MTFNLKSKVPCQLIELGLSCFGCCGNSFSGKNEILEDLRLNTLEFNDMVSKKPTVKDLENFKRRAGITPDVISENGLCFQLVDFGGGCVGCPLHNKINEIIPKSKYEFPGNKDLRVGECDVNFECETYIYWKLMNEEQRKDFVQFVKEKKLKMYEYSILNVEGKLIKEFFEKTNHLV